MGESSAEDTYIYAETLAAELGQVSASAYLANTRQRIDRAIMVLGDGRVAEDTSAGAPPPTSAIEDVSRSSAGPGRSLDGECLRCRCQAEAHRCAGLMLRGEDWSTWKLLAAGGTDGRKTARWLKWWQSVPWRRRLTNLLL